MRTHVSGEFLLGVVEVSLDLLEPLLEDGDEANASVDWVTEAGLRFVGQRVHGVFALRSVELVEDLGDIAGPEYLVDVGELLGLVRWEIRREHALLRAFSPEKLTGCAR